MERPEVVTLTNGVFAENCYLVADPASREAVIVDPGEEAGLFLARLAAAGWTPRAVWLTHAHLDHIAGVAEIKRATGVPVLLHPADRQLYDAAPHQARMFGLEMEPAPPPDGPLQGGTQVSIGRFAFDVLHVPGHSPGHVAFVGHGLCLSGDVLFAGSIGRTDLPGGNTQTLLDSIRDRLYQLPGDTQVLPGHGPATTIAAELQGNPFVAVPKQARTCQRCGAPVRPKPWGCKNPCPNCGTVYPLGDCSD